MRCEVAHHHAASGALMSGNRWLTYGFITQRTTWNSATTKLTPILKLLIGADNRRVGTAGQATAFHFR